MSKAIAVFCNSSHNLGDEIQSIAVMDALWETLQLKPTYYVCRDDFTQVYDASTGEKTEITQPTILIIHGWLLHGPDSHNNKNIKFPPIHPLITPFLIGVHLPTWLPDVWQPTALEYYRKYNPILTRDLATATHLNRHDIRASKFGCFTQTLQPRTPTGGNEIIFVDVPETQAWPLFQQWAKTDAKKVTITHGLNCDTECTWSPKKRFEAARALLDRYTAARHIYTSRLHCFLPCKAMGLPVTYLGVFEERTVDLIGTHTVDRNAMLALFSTKLKQLLREEEEEAEVDCF